MWNDGYSKEQPWLNYFNSYELMHCCFEGDGGVGTGGPGVEDDIVNVAPTDFSIGPTSYSMNPDGTVTDRNAADPDPDPRDSTYDAGTNTFSFAQDKDTDTFASDIATIGFENFANPNELDLATMEDMSENPDAYGMGYNDFVDMGYFDKAEAADFKSSQADAAALENSLREQGLEVNVAVDRNNNYSYTGKDAFQAATGEIGKSIGDFAGAVGTGVEGMANFMSMISPTGWMTSEAKKALGEGLGIDMGPSSFDQLQVALGLKDAPETTTTKSKDKDAEDLSPLMDSFINRSTEELDAAIPEPFNPSGAALGGMTEDELKEGYAQEAFDLGYGPSSLGYSGAALGGMTEDELKEGYAQEALQSIYSTTPTQSQSYSPDRGPPIGTVNTMYSRNFPNTQDSQNYWSTENEYEFEPQDGDGDPITKRVPPLPSPVVVDEPPKTALELYFERLNKRRGTAGSVNPYYLEGSTAGNMANVVPRNPIDNAAYRRNLALATPRYQEPSGPNQSIATFAAAYGMTYDEAAKRFAPPSVPAMGGGGLRGLMEYS